MPPIRMLSGALLNTADFYLLAKNINPTNANEVNDGNSPQGNIIQFVNGQELGTDRRLVGRYQAMQRDFPTPSIGANDCGQLGPRLLSRATPHQHQGQHDGLFADSLNGQDLS